MKNRDKVVLVLGVTALIVVGLSAAMSCYETPSALDEHEAGWAPAKSPYTPGQIGPFVIPATWQQSAWCVDPSVTLSCTSDNNRTCSACNCSTAGDGPCKSFGSITSRWGSASPILNQYTTIALLSGEPDTYTDVVTWSPACGTNTNGTLMGGLMIKGTPTIVATGAISAGTNLSQSGNTLGHANLAALAPDAAALSVGYYALDTTLSPNAGMYLEANTSGTVWNLTTPIRAFSTIGFNAGAPGWALIGTIPSIGATDTFQIETFPAMNLAAMLPSGLVLHDSACVAITNVTLNSGNASTWGSLIAVGQGVELADNSIHGQISAQPGARLPADNSGFGRGYAYTTVLYNDDVWSIDNAGPAGQTGVISGSDRPASPLLIAGGAMAIDSTANQPVSGDYSVDNLGDVDIEQDFVIGPNVGHGFVTVGRGRASSIANFTLGGVSGDKVLFTENFSLNTDLVDQELGVIWGTGNWAIQNNVNFSYTQAPASVFLTSGTITIDGQSTMCSLYAPGAYQANTIFCGIPFSAANLAATAGDGGFGNNAFIVGGVRIWQVSTE